MEEHAFIEKLLNDCPSESARVQNELNNLKENLDVHDDKDCFIEELVTKYKTSSERCAAELQSFKRKLPCEGDDRSQPKHRRTKVETTQKFQCNECVTRLSRKENIWLGIKDYNACTAQLFFPEMILFDDI